MVKIIQQREKCIGCGACASLCHKYWDMSDDGKSTLKDAILNSETGDYELETKEVGCNEEAADSCPVQCIVVSSKKIVN